MDTLIFNALAEPSRLRIIDLLKSGPLPVNFIARSLSLRQPQVSKHLHVLSEAGFVTVRPIAQQRVYHLQSKPFQEIESWAVAYRRQWEGRMDKLDEYVQELK